MEQKQTEGYGNRCDGQVDGNQAIQADLAAV